MQIEQGAVVFVLVNSRLLQRLQQDLIAKIKVIASHAFENKCKIKVKYIGASVKRAQHGDQRAEPSVFPLRKLRQTLLQANDIANDLQRAVRIHPLQLPQVRQEQVLAKR